MERVLEMDIESFSDVDLIKCGVYAYADSPAFEILLFAYSFDGVVILFMLSAPAAIRCFLEQKFLCSFCYIVFSLFVPALACFSGECSRSRRAFETVYLLICFLLLNMPSFLFQGYVAAVMLAGTVVFLSIALMKRLHL